MEIVIKKTIIDYPATFASMEKGETVELDCREVGRWNTIRMNVKRENDRLAEEGSDRRYTAEPLDNDTRARITCVEVEAEAGATRSGATCSLWRRWR